MPSVIISYWRRRFAPFFMRGIINKKLEIALMSIVRPILSELVRPLVSTLSVCRVVPIFNGIDQYMTIPNYQNPSSTFAFSFSIIPVSVDVIQIIIDSDTTNNYARLQAGGTLRLRLTDTLAGIHTLQSLAPLVVGVKYDVRCEITPAKIELFIDDVSQATSSITSPLVLTPNWNSVGATSLGSSPFNGSIFDVNLNDLRFYGMNDGFSANPVGVDSISSQNGTFVNMTSAAWENFCE